MNASHHGITRRRVVRGSAWAAPAIVVGAAAPRAAASPCPPVSYTVNWSNPSFVRTSSTKASVRATSQNASAPPITLTVTASYTGAMKSGTETSGDDSLSAVGQVGGSFANGLRIQQTVTTPVYSTPKRAARGAYTFAFTGPDGKPVSVSNLAFTVTDIDSTAGDFWDVVELSGTFSSTAASGVTGTGTTDSPATAASSNTAFADTTSSAGNLNVTYQAPTSSVILTYWNNAQKFSGVDRSQGIYIAGMTFSAIANNC